MNFKEMNELRKKRIFVLRKLKTQGFVEMDGILYEANHLDIISHGEDVNGKLILECLDCGASDFGGSFEQPCSFVTTSKDGILGLYDPLNILDDIKMEMVE